MNGNPFDVFLGYSRAGQATVKRVAQVPHAYGLGSSSTADISSPLAVRGRGTRAPRVNAPAAGTSMTAASAAGMGPALPRRGNNGVRRAQPPVRCSGSRVWPRSFLATAARTTAGRASSRRGSRPSSTAACSSISTARPASGPATCGNRQLYDKLRQCQVVLALVSRDWLDSRWCFAEAVQAREKGKRLVLARIDDVDTSTLFRDAQHLDFMGDEADALARLEAALVDVFDLQPDRKPYPGLVPFDEADAGVFVGRDPEIAILLEALESMRLKSRAGGECLLLLLGASGSGKSSLVRAGVLPRPAPVAGTLAAPAADAAWARPRARAGPPPGRSSCVKTWRRLQAGSRPQVRTTADRSSP